MSAKYILKPVVFCYAVGILGIVTLAMWTPISVKAQAESQQVAPTNARRAKSPKEFNLAGKGEPFLPSSLNQSRQADDGRQGTRGVIGTDDRRPMISKKYPWSAIGRVQGLNAGGQGYHCTGTLVSEDVVLTNSHCVVDTKTHQINPKIAFLPNLIDGAVQDKNDIAYATNIYAGTDFKDQSFVNDWALIKLDKPIGKKYGYLGWKSFSSETLVQNRKKYFFVGYSGDFPKPGVYEDLKAGKGFTAAVQGGCSITGEEGGVLLHNCDTAGGSSGGPIITWIDRKPYIVALNNAEIKSRDGRGIVNLGVKISQVEEAIK
jgi:V8-like Glu-specific endopeptidase